MRKFPLEKIVTESAEVWFKMNGKNPEDYCCKGVHSGGNCEVIELDGKKIVVPPADFVRMIPEDAEVVTSFSLSISSARYKTQPNEYPERLELLYFASGTALAPKKK